jgi:hypothetical protein
MSASNTNIIGLNLNRSIRNNEKNKFSFKFHNHANNKVPFKFPNSNSDPKYVNPITSVNLYPGNSSIRKRIVSIVRTNKIHNPNGTVTSTIMAFAEIYVNASAKTVEIYNVFTQAAFRGKGYTFVLLETLKYKYKGSTLWLGVLPQNTSAISAYLKAGFTSKIKYTNKSPFGYTFGFYFIQMVYNPDKPVLTNPKLAEDIIARARAKINQKQKYNALFSGNSSAVNRTALEVLNVRFTLTSKFMKSIQTFLGIRNNRLNKEYGGIIRFNYKKGYKMYESFPGIAPENFAVGKGNNENVYKFQVMIPTVPEGTMQKAISIPFHCHPEKCYALHKVCMGLPSPRDITIYIERFLRGETVSAIDIVFAVEAVYICSFKRTFITFVLSRTPAQRNALINELLERKQEIESEINKVGNKSGSSTQLKNFPSVQKGFTEYLWATYKAKLESITIGGRLVHKIARVLNTGTIQDVTFSGPLLMRHHKTKKVGLAGGIAPMQN